MEYVVLGVIIELCIYIIYKIFEAKYYRGEEFAKIKEEAKKYVDECNELNRYIESLKNEDYINNDIDYGHSNFVDKSKYNYKRPEHKKIKFAPHIYNCSRTVCDSSRKKPLAYLCKYFNIKFEEEYLIKIETMLNNYETVEKGKELLVKKKREIVNTIRKKVPFVLLALGDKNLAKKLGFQKIDIKTVYFPKYIFRYVSPGGNASYENQIELNIDNLNKLIKFLSESIKFKNSVVGQRALLTSKLRKKILLRDQYKCKHCGISIEEEPHLLLEVDHIIPLSKGGVTSEENLQVLCWKCNRHKGSKIV